MPYDRYGRTPEQAKRERRQEWICVAVLMLLLAGIVCSAWLVVALVIGA